jgi:hypothetical protein
MAIKQLHENLYFLLVPFSLLLYSSSSLKDNDIAKVKHQDKTFHFRSSDRLKYDSVKVKYDTLIPIFDGLFVTYHQIDNIHYLDCSKKNKRDSIEAFYSGDFITINTRKWGVIDSVGNVIVPFICDGAKEISDNKGVVSVFSTSFSLNTGIPRYEYFGTYYFFTKEGLLYETKKEFSITIEYLADWHNSEFVIQQGPEFYLPSEYRKVKR